MPDPTPVPTPITIPVTIDPNAPGQKMGGFHGGISLLGGWFPETLAILTVVLLTAVVIRRPNRWLWIWLPITALLGFGASMAAKAYMDSEGLADDPAPVQLWWWIAIAAAGIVLFVIGWRRVSWWRRGFAALLIPVSILTVLVTINQWVGYYPTLQTAWSALTAGPLPDEVDAGDLAGLRGTNPTTGKIVEVDIPGDASHFNHRSEYVYLPPAWFAGATPPQLPVLMMIAGEFNTPADWVRSGNAVPTIDAFAQAHNGQAPILVFVDAGGSFNNDTECVNGPRGNAADHLTKDVRPYVISHFNASPDAAHWGVVGWSMGGTCAINLTVMHPDMFSTFEDIAGDTAPSAGTKDQTLARLYNGNQALADSFDPMTTMAKHGPYTGVTGWFEDTAPPQRKQGQHPPGNWNHNRKAPQRAAPNGFGGRDDNMGGSAEFGAANKLCTAALQVSIPCAIYTAQSGHTWQFAATAFHDALPWLSSRIGVPGVPDVPVLPTPPATATSTGAGNQAAPR